MNSSLTTQAPATVPSSARTSIDLLNPAQTCAELRIDERRLLRLINEAQLAAYDLGEGIRFRYRDVSALAGRYTLAAA